MQSACTSEEIVSGKKPLASMPRAVLKANEPLPWPMSKSTPRWRASMTARFTVPCAVTGAFGKGRNACVRTSPGRRRVLASANASPSEGQPAAGVSLEFNKEDGTLYIDLSGPIVAGTADDVRAALSKYGTALNRVVLFLDSAGGRVDDGDRLIEALNEVKLRHQLVTVVPHGKLCASMCIPISLQGEDRLAAPVSSLAPSWRD